MKKQNWFKDRLNGFKEDFEFRLEMLILNLTEIICERMKQKNIGRAGLAKMLDISPAAVTKILNGNNFTIKTLLSLADALDAELIITFKNKVSEDLSSDVSEEASGESSRGAISGSMGDP